MLEEPATPLVESSSVRNSRFRTNHACRVLVQRRLWLLAAVANIIFIYFTIIQFRVNRGYHEKLVLKLKTTPPDPKSEWEVDDITKKGEANAGASTLEYIVNTTSCKIPDFDPWDKSIQLLDTKCDPGDTIDPQCRDKCSRQWMYSNGTDLHVNQTAIVGSGYSWSSLHCCYKVIKRVQQSPQEYDMNADNVVRYSRECTKIESMITPIKSDFIRVFCIATSLPISGDVVYREYFAFAQLDPRALEKVSSWKEVPLEEFPPNVIILGVDTNSRLNSRRRFHKTLNVLREAGAVEMMGYTKVGENTFPNTIAFLTGMNESAMESLCHSSEKDAQDDCPYAWKDFDQAGYLTATSDDVPYASSFNYMKTGFVLKPTDFYYRPFTLAVMKQPRETPWFIKCIGPYQADELLLRYQQQILERSYAKAPVFLHSWLTTYTHHCIHGAMFMDGPMSRFFQTLLSKFPNTILFFMSDHGDRFGKFRESVLGWYEDKLPTMWVHLPPQLRLKYPHWYEALKVNSGRLTSHFDLYSTLSHILNTFTGPKIRTSQNLPSKSPGRSLFSPIPENRTCPEAGIPESYCACAQPQVLDVRQSNSSLQAAIQNAADSTTLYLSRVLPEQCARLEVKKIVSARLIQPHDNSLMTFIISFYTDPGDFLFEATVVQDSSTEEPFKLQSLNDILRMNKITRKVDCVTNYALERYCYCL